MASSTIMAILIDKRTDAAPKVQEILTAFGCIIDARIGLHEVKNCVEEGLIILRLCGEEDEINNLEDTLKNVHRVDVKKMKVSFN